MPYIGLSLTGRQSIPARLLKIFQVIPHPIFLGHKRNWARVVHPEDIQRVEEQIHAAVARKEPYDFEYRIFHADGDERWMYEKGRAIY